MVVPIRRPSGPSRTEILSRCKCFLGRLVDAMENPTGDSIMSKRPVGPTSAAPAYRHGTSCSTSSIPATATWRPAKISDPPMSPEPLRHTSFAVDTRCAVVSDTESLWWLSPAFGMASMTWTITTVSHWSVGINRFEQHFSRPNRCHASNPVVDALRQHTAACVAPWCTSRHPGPMAAYGSGYRCRRL